MSISYSNLTSFKGDGSNPMGKVRHIFALLSVLGKCNVNWLHEVCSASGADNASTDVDGCRPYWKNWRDVSATICCFQGEALTYTARMISLGNKVNLQKEKYMYFIDPIFSVYLGFILNVTLCLVDINCCNKYM